MNKNKLSIVAQAKVFSDFLIGLAITWTAGGIASPFLTQEITLKGLLPLILGCLASSLCLHVAVEYKKRLKI